MPGRRVELGPRSYRVEVGQGILHRLGKMCARLLESRRVTLVTSSRIMALHGSAVQKSLVAAGFEVHRVTARDGEHLKTLTGVGRIFDRLARIGHERGEPLVVMGGGTLGDAGGFVAATYLRGVPLVQIPTTLLAQVDSAIGGKTAINLYWGKNLVGAIWQPRLVVCDTDTLRTLPPRELASGMAEVVKYACIARPALLATIERVLSGPGRSKPLVPASLVSACVAIKARIVAEDERESDQRRILNFGHTLGHAYETAAIRPPLSHGEAVALGILVALEISSTRFKLHPRHHVRVALLLRRIFPRLNFPAIRFSALDSLMARDKKVRGGERLWVLLEAPGRPVVQSLRRPEIEHALSSAQARWRSCG